MIVMLPGGNFIAIIGEINNKNNWVQYNDLFQQQAKFPVYCLCIYPKYAIEFWIFMVASALIQFATTVKLEQSSNNI